MRARPRNDALRGTRPDDPDSGEQLATDQGPATTAEKAIDEDMGRAPASPARRGQASWVAGIGADLLRGTARLAGEPEAEVTAPWWRRRECAMT